MIAPHKLLGLKYRLGSNPEQHGTADCLSLVTAVVRYHGFIAPAPRRSWYRRLRKGDYNVFKEELAIWGVEIEQPRIGSVALCQTDQGGYGLAAFWEDGWISFVGSEVSWSPLDALLVAACFYPQKRNCVTQSA